jgi:hypothetical protein
MECHEMEFDVRRGMDVRHPLLGVANAGNIGR